MSRSFFERYSFPIVLVVVFSLSFLIMGTRRTLMSNSNNVKDWLPDNFEETAEHTWFNDHFPFEMFVLASWEGCNLDDPRLELLARKLVPEPPQPVLEAEVAIGGDLYPAPESEVTVEEVEEPSEPKLFKKVLTGPRLIAQLKARYPSLSDEEVLERLEGSLIGPDHYRTCLMVTLTDAAKGKNLRSTLERIRELARECNIEPEVENADGPPLARATSALVGTVHEMLFGRETDTDGIIMGGPPVDNVAIDVEGERTLMRLAGLSALVGLGISFVCFRSLRLTGIVFWIALLSAGVGMSIVFFTGGRCDAILLSMPSLVYVLAMSSAIHIVNYYHDAIREKGLKGAPDRAVAHAWFPCTMAAGTTAVGLGSLLVSHVIPISKFGVYSALGVLATLGMVFLYLPALLHFFPSKKYAEKFGGKGDVDTSETALQRFWAFVGRRIIRHNVLVSTGCVGLMIFFAFGLPKIHTSVQLMKLFSADAEIITDYRWLENNLGPLTPMEIVITFDNDVNDMSISERMRLVSSIERLVEERFPEDVGGAMSAGIMAPDMNEERGGRFDFTKTMAKSALDSALEENRPAFRDYLTIDGDPSLTEMGVPEKLVKILEAQGITGLQSLIHRDPETVVRGISPERLAKLDQRAAEWQKEHGLELWRISTRVWALKKDIKYHEFVNDLKDAIDPALAKWQADNDQEGIEARYTGLVPLVYKTQSELMRGLTNSLMTAFGLIAVVMVIVLRSPSAGLLSMIPNVFPVVIVFGFMGWAGVLVDIGTMMTASVALGVAVDDTMHYLTWFRNGMDQGLDRKGAAMMAYNRCATAMSQTTLIGGLGLAAFSFSTFTPTQRFGTLMLVLLFAALIGDLIFLPAVLTGPLGRFFDPKRKKAKRRRDARSPSLRLSAEGETHAPADVASVENEIISAAHRGESSALNPHLRATGTDEPTFRVHRSDQAHE